MLIEPAEGFRSATWRSVMEEPAESQPSRGPATGSASGLDAVDNCRMRLVSLRTRIESNWPAAGGRFFRRGAGLGPHDQASIEALLDALPTPLPLVPGGPAQAIITETDTDLMAVAGRAVDASFALLDGATMESEYPGDVTLLDSRRPEAREPIVVSRPTVGLLVSTIIGTLEAIYETISATLPPPADARKGRAPTDVTVRGATVKSTGKKGGAEDRRGRRVPRI
jgi:hypothetical protein